MPDGGDDHFGTFRLGGEENQIRPRSWHPGPAGQTTGGRKAFRVLANDIEKSPEFATESLAQPRLPVFVEGNGLNQFLFRLFLNDNPKTHAYIDYSNRRAAHLFVCREQ